MMVWTKAFSGWPWAAFAENIFRSKRALSVNMIPASNHARLNENWGIESSVPQHAFQTLSSRAELPAIAMWSCGNNAWTL